MYFKEAEMLDTSASFAREAGNRVAKSPGSDLEEPEQLPDLP